MASVRVRALVKLFDGAALRNEGDVFEVDESQVGSSAFEQLEPVEPKQPKQPRQAKPKPVDPDSVL